MWHSFAVIGKPDADSVVPDTKFWSDDGKPNFFDSDVRKRVHYSLDCMSNLQKLMREPKVKPNELMS